ncbi:hypothetical protein [Naumannella cuiyingiana]|uniref:Uncharacterized protein n=1 Tax=Naumannella cuiyingiana TaxID=1347891 RepID=A0A7Z0DBV1_9ACTN|nr:hypothetical protein [Naumannella cuiyingiana]NYI72433.1 hypothetical protein [Naumannella cuiyingiana]
MWWALLFGVIVLIWLVSAGWLLLRLYRKFRALLRSADRLTRQLGEGLDLLARVGGESAVAPDADDVKWNRPGPDPHAARPA